MMGRIAPPTQTHQPKNCRERVIFAANSADSRLSEAKEAQYRNHDDDRSDEPNYVVHDVSPENLLLGVNSSEPTNVPAFSVSKQMAAIPFIGGQTKVRAVYD